MPAFEWVHVQLHQQKGMISLSPPTICNSAKIDRIFIANIDDPVKRALLVSVVKGLRGTGKPLMFEGVETPGQFEFVRSLGPGYLVQGWYTGKPETISAMNIQG
ncbi:EAL domain-containing protein [Klebsiella pneumoniae]|nr:EAL domain-containing protein [Klebsiella pneumoniae]MDQ4801003.1 EAL domain-containing protein [Klebsiella pneumoniae]MDQ4806638.1 EAL domain-containing protein [Klebsiella pneumoniae]MDQ4812216.1 EAL domain-containing protein [Klebsiella pneumoniae]MDQ4839743.1 EAL domain-containing protein [Klebsiella pneumoniae]